MAHVYQTEVFLRNGRNGRATSNDRKLDLPLALQKEFGGNGEGTNPEQLFAAGFGACFESTLLFLAGQKKIDLTSLELSCIVTVLSDPKGGFLLDAELKIKAPQVNKEVLSGLIKEAEGICPYHKMAKGGISHWISQN